MKTSPKIAGTTLQSPIQGCCRVPSNEDLYSFFWSSSRVCWSTKAVVSSKAISSSYHTSRASLLSGIVDTTMTMKPATDAARSLLKSGVGVRPRPPPHDWTPAGRVRTFMEKQHTYTHTNMETHINHLHINRSRDRQIDIAEEKSKEKPQGFGSQWSVRCGISGVTFCFYVLHMFNYRISYVAMRAAAARKS